MHGACREVISRCEASVEGLRNRKRGNGLRISKNFSAWRFGACRTQRKFTPQRDDCEAQRSQTLENAAFHAVSHRRCACHKFVTDSASASHGPLSLIGPPNRTSPSDTAQGSQRRDRLVLQSLV